MKKIFIPLFIFILFISINNFVFANDLSVVHYKQSDGNLHLTIDPKKIVEGDDITIRFNDIGADYYVISAICKDGTSVSGKALPDICNEGERFYPTGKDVIRVDNFYPFASGRNTFFHIKVSAFVDNKVVKTDYEDVEITSAKLKENKYNLEIKQHSQYINIKWDAKKRGNYRLIINCTEGANFSSKERILSTRCMSGVLGSLLADYKNQDHNTMSLELNNFTPGSQLTFRLTTDYDESRALIEKTIILDDLDENKNFNYLFEKYGDVNFIHPREGQRKIEEVYEGDNYTIKWKNVFDSDWDIDLYRYNSSVPENYLINGPKNETVGVYIATLKKVSSNQKQQVVQLPDSLTPGHYYFKFSGKVAGDGSPAIRIIKRNPLEKGDIGLNNNKSNKNILQLIVNILKNNKQDNSNNKLIQILELIIQILDKS